MNAGLRKSLIDGIGASISEQTLRWVVARHQVIGDFDTLVKQQTGSVDERFVSVVAAVIDHYEAQGQLPELIVGIYSICLNQPGAWSLLNLMDPLLGPQGADLRQALTARRNNFFFINNLFSQLEAVKPCVCLIAGHYDLGGSVYEPTGTGFLVGPDLVLTTMHVFDHLYSLAANRIPASFSVYFDHLQGQAISPLSPVPAGLRRVGLAANWLVAHAASIPWDGQVDNPDAAQIALLQQDLDFALIKLDEPVGSEPISRWGGPYRGWVTLPPAGTSMQLADDSRVVIPQHPGGQPQSIDFGRFCGTCRSSTRMYYSTAAAKGSSGAPCFNREFNLVGMHNAEFNPNKLSIAPANQAILFDAILARVQALVQAALPPMPPSRPARLWNLSLEDGVFWPIIGRSVFLDWIEGARSQTTSDKAHRLFCADIPESRAGRTFSTDILDYSLKSDPNSVYVVFGPNRETLPSRIEDLLMILAVYFKVPLSAIAALPPRPALDMPSGSSDDDKLHRWASQTVPNWFAQVLKEYLPSTVDKRILAQRSVAQSTALGIAPDPQALQLANHPHAVWEERWTLGWVSLDDPAHMAITPEVQGFLAGMAGVGQDEKDIPEMLRRIRWLYLGCCPDFLAGASPCVELITPDSHLEDVKTLVDSALAAGRRADPVKLQMLSTALITVLTSPVPSNLSRSERMAMAQVLASNLLPLLLP